MRNRFFATVGKMLGNKIVVFSKSVKMCLVVATLFYMLKMICSLDFSPYARMDGCTPFRKPPKMPYHKIKFFRDIFFIFSMVLFCFLGARFLICYMVKISFESLTIIFSSGIWWFLFISAVLL